MSELIVQEAIEFVENIQQDIEEKVNAVISLYSDRSKQQLITEMVRYVDFLFESETTNTCSVSKEMVNIVEFAIPIFLRCAIYKEKKLIGNILAPTNEERKKQIKEILEHQQIYGLLELCKGHLKVDLMEVVDVKKNEMKLKFKNLYHDLERIDRMSVVSYSHRVLQKIIPYNIELAKKLKSVQDKMDKLVYKWNENFIGYGAESEIDYIYMYHAVLDMIQSTEWNVFEPDDEFGGVRYSVYVDAVVLLESFSLKHLQFVYLSLEKYKNLDKYNLLPVYETKDTISEILEIALQIPRKKVNVLLETLVLKQGDLENMNSENIPFPPYIEIADEYFIRSYAGCLYEPMEFVLFKLKKLFRSDWDKNIQKREKIFRREFYELFPDHFYKKYDKSIVIKESGKFITDIDVCMYEKSSGNILFVQLKWQDSIYESFNSMVSKRKNYLEKVDKWILAMKKWIEDNSEEGIANYLQLKPNQVNKEKIHLLVMGRFNGEYSTSGMLEHGVPYCQWFELKNMLEENRDRVESGCWGIKEIYLKLFDLMKIREQRREIMSGIEYSGKRIIYDGLFYNEA